MDGFLPFAQARDFQPYFFVSDKARTMTQHGMEAAADDPSPRSRGQHQGKRPLGTRRSGKRRPYGRSTIERARGKEDMDRSIERTADRVVQRVTTTLLQWIGRLLGPLWDRPRVLQCAVALVGVALTAWGLFPQEGTSAQAVTGTVAATTQDDPVQPREETDAPMAGQSPLEVVAAYNAASITAGATGRADVLLPFLAPDGAAWRAAEREFARRAEHGERHHPTLVRWGIVEQRTAATHASIHTQEVWDDETVIAGVLVDARRGMVQRIRYDLERPDPSQPWRIETVESQIILP
jgi:hypothetical protein